MVAKPYYTVLAKPSDTIQNFGPVRTPYATGNLPIHPLQLFITTVMSIQYLKDDDNEIQKTGRNTL